jgi:hypothetical protein
MKFHKAQVQPKRRQLQHEWYFSWIVSHFLDSCSVVGVGVVIVCVFEYYFISSLMQAGMTVRGPTSSGACSALGQGDPL